MSDQTPSSDEKRRGAAPFPDPGDLLVSLVLLAGAGYLYYLTTQFDEPSALLGENVGPADFPRLVIYFIAILAVILPFESRLQPERWQKIWEGRHKPVNALTWLSIGFLFAVSLAAPYLGTIITMLLVSLLLPLLWGERRFGLIISFAVLFTLAVTWVFNVILKVYFEPGIFSVTAKLIPFF
jgi:putative tricarboxylic transport membrane protein